MAVAMTVDALVGWPDVLFARIGHPVTWLGRLIGWLDMTCNRTSDPAPLRRAAGIVTALVVIGLSAALGLLVQSLVISEWRGVIVVGILAWPLVALRSLYDHVAAVVDPL